MFGKNNNSSNEINSIIGEGSYFKGTFSLNGALSIDGSYEGETLEVNNLFVGKTGKVKSNIQAVSVTIEGIVIGNIKAESRVMLMPTSRVLGEITTPELIIQNGVVLEGKCMVSPPSVENPKELVMSLYEESE